KQGLCMQGTRSVGGKEITQVERQRWIADSLVVGIARRKGNVTPALVLSRLEQEQIDPVRRRRAFVDSVRRVGRNRDVAAAARSKIMIGDAVVDKILQNSGDRSECKWSAHRPPSCRDLR